MASYFSYFPNVYVGEGVTAEEGFKYRLTKNIFRRIKARDDLDQYTSSFESYSIKDSESPSSLAYRAFGDPHLDWVILLVNNITDFYEGWPKSEDNLRSYVAEKYNDPDKIHHYETNEILYNDIVFVPKGVEVNASYRAILPDGTTKTAEESRYAITNYEHEYYLNEKKRLIVIPTSYALSVIESEMEQLLSYEPHIELDAIGNKKTPLSISSRFINNDAAIIGSASNVSSLGAVTSFDNGPTSAGTSSATTSTTTTTTTTTTSSSSSSGSSGSGGSGSGGSGGGSGY